MTKIVLSLANTTGIFEESTESFNADVVEELRKLTKKRTLKLIRVTIEAEK